MTGDHNYVYKMLMEQTKKSSPSARNKMMDLLSHREHSETEIRLKLEGQFSSDEIDQAIKFGKEKKWIPSNPDEAYLLSEKYAEVLRRKGKGIEFINQYLEEKGLPTITASTDDELENIQKLISKKFPQFYEKQVAGQRPPSNDMNIGHADEDASLDFQKEQLQAKIARFLISRGFNSEIVRKVLYDNSAE